MNINFDVSIEEVECLSCKIKRKCLYIDASEGEYTAGVICNECIDALFSDCGDNISR